MSKVKYTDAPEVRQIAEELIPKYHQPLQDHKVRIEYVFCSKTPSKSGQDVWGTCRKITSLNAFLANRNEGSDPFFVITISEPVWAVLPPDKRIALIDHELSHASVTIKEATEDDDGEEDPRQLSVMPHDLEEFTCIVRRHGLWRDSVKDFVNTALSKNRHVANDEDGTNEGDG